MKIKKRLSIALALVCSVSLCFSNITFAQNESSVKTFAISPEGGAEDLTISTFTVKDSKVSTKADTVTELKKLKDYWGNTLSDDFYFFYDGKSQVKKTVYAKIKQGMIDRAERIDLASRSTSTDTVTVSEIDEILCGVLFDNPELFWCDLNFSIANYSNGKVAYIVPTYNDLALDIDKYQKEIDDALAYPLYVMSTFSTDIAKVKYAHDYLIHTIDYTSDVDYDQTMYSAIIGRKSVCAGYAHSFQYMMQKMRIPCAYISGYVGDGGHAWNLIKLGSEYYAIDVTFDDPILINSSGEEFFDSNYYSYKYFNVTDAYMESTRHYRDEFSINLPIATGTFYSYNNYYNGNAYGTDFDKIEVTTVAPTTIIPTTEVTTTETPTTEEITTTVAPTTTEEITTTVAPTTTEEITNTVELTTIEETTAEASTTTTYETTSNIVEEVSKPVGVEGADNNEFPYCFSWAPMENVDGFNVFVNGIYVDTVIGNCIYLDKDYFQTSGNYALGVQAIKGGKVSEIAIFNHYFDIEEITTTEVPIITTTEMSTEETSEVSTTEPSTEETSEVSTTEASTEETSVSSTTTADNTTTTLIIDETSETSTTTADETTALVTTVAPTTTDMIESTSTNEQSTSVSDDDADDEEDDDDDEEDDDWDDDDDDDKDQIDNPSDSKTILKKPSIKKLSVKKRRLTIKWTKGDTSIRGYQIQYALNKKFKKAKKKTIYNIKKISFTTKKLKLKKKYYVRVRVFTYDKNEKNVYSDWSNVKYKKIK